MTDRLLRAPEVIARTGLSRTTIWRRERKGEFPRRRQIHGNVVAWLESEIDQWIADRPPVDLGDSPTDNIDPAA